MSVIFAVAKYCVTNVHIRKMDSPRTICVRVVLRLQNFFFKLKRSKLFRQLASTLTSLFLVRVKESSKKKAPRPKYLSMTQLMPLERQEVKGAMKLSLLRRRSCYKNAKGQRYLGVGENNSLTLGLAFRNICSHSVAKRSLKLPEKPLHMVGLWIIQRERRKRKLFIKFTFSRPWIAWNNYQVIINLLNVLVLRSEAETKMFSNKFCHQNLLLWDNQ